MLLSSRRLVERPLARVVASLFVLGAFGAVTLSLAAATQPTNVSWLETQIRTAKLFEEPLVATGPSSAEEQQALWQALEQYRASGSAEHIAPLQAFLDAHPDSPWGLALRTNLGLTYYQLGYFSRAIDAWESAWRESRALSQPQAKRLADRALGELLRMHARLGHADRVEALLKESKDRPLQGPATEAVAGAREGLWMMRNDHGVAYLCGPMALKSILQAQGADPARIAALDAVRSGPHGITLETVGELAQRVKLPYTIARRAPGTPIPLPAVVHWKVNHYAAIVGEEGGRYHLKDPTFGRDLWISKDALESETSNYFVIPEQAAKQPGWSQVVLAEAKQIVGMGATTAVDNARTTPDDPKACDCEAQGQGASGAGDANSGMENVGMPRYNVHAMLVSLNLVDTPVSYRPPKGPAIGLTLTYNQREANQPANFTYSNFGPKWTFNWLSFVQDDPGSPGSNVMRYVAGGGAVFPSGYNGSAFSPDAQDLSVLVRTSATSYERRLKNGSKEIYAQPDGATFYPRRVFLTQIVDREGNAVTLSYDSQQRLTAITDAAGKRTTFTYGNASNSTLVTQITDPFGRTARLGYDASGRLSDITDAIGMKSSFSYDAGTFINALTTPYGTTKFAYGENGVQRWINITNPQGQTERVEYRHQAPGISYTESQTPGGMSVFNTFINYRNTFYWNADAYAQAPDDYTKARITHWLHTNNINMTAGAIESTKEPLENRVWYTYANQPFPAGVGSTEQPTAVARVLDDGSTQLMRTSYNAQGNVTAQSDAVGRQALYDYADNGVDVLRVKRVNGGSTDLLAEYTYNDQHEPLTYRDAAGQLTTYTYNAAGQKTSETNALGQTTRWEYDANGFLQRVVNANGKTAASYAYDAIGRIAGQTDSEGRTVKYQYDALNRLTLTQYPDGTTRRQTWDKLDLASTTDRLGRVTRYTYDSARRLVQVTDPLGRRIQYGYYPNGKLKTLTDAAGNVTTWQRDIQGRVISKTYADGKGDTLAYEATTSRLKRITDALGQSKTFSYTMDDRVAELDYSGATNPTASVSYRYDSAYPRISSVTDGTGSHNYSYNAVGSLGANRVSEETVPGQSDTLRTQYDALGRPTERRIGSLSETWSYDALGRQVGHGTPLGQFSYAYLGETGQTSSQQLEGSQLRTAYRYEDNRNDRRLKAIDNDGGAMKGGWTGGYGDQDRDRDALAGSLHMQGGRMPKGDGWHDSGRWNEGDRWHEGGRHGDYGHHERSPWPPFGHGHGGAPAHRASSFFYETDAENRIVSLLEAGREGLKPHWYRYDAADRLLADDSRSWNDRRYSYDAADNRTSATSRTAKQTIVPNALNQMQTVNGQPTQYDAAGNLLEDEARQYDWDAEHRLIRIRYKAQAGKETRFGYDGLGRRTVITEVDGTGTTETHYVWCGEAICQKRDANGQLLRAYYPEGESGPEIGKRVAKADAATETDEDGDEHDGRDQDGNDGKSAPQTESTGSLIYARNHLGSVTDTLTPDGRAVAHTEYGPYGELVKSQGRAEYRSDFGYAGMQYHAASGMYLTLFRAYDPGTGRWVSRDPMGERGGFNLYGYVAGNPLTYVDPFGLALTTVDAAIEQAIRRGDIEELQALMEAANPEQASVIQRAMKPARDLIRGQTRRSSSYARESLINEVVNGIASHPTPEFSDRGRKVPIQHGFPLFLCLSWRALRAQDGMLPGLVSSCLLASTRFARPNKLNSCAVFLASPL
ncbi:RHS repeat-associated core domain-containing protein (plasmid) [Ralstonia solanacearum P673]|uniref:RHS repeat-associated core domain-containing protein n=3 Tax=Ralstonia solanacearum TaxID=305 RepID=UPI0038579EAA